jgi:hypothetical protein
VGPACGEPDKPFLRFFWCIFFEGPAGKGPFVVVGPGREKKCKNNPGDTLYGGEETIFTQPRQGVGLIFTSRGRRVEASQLLKVQSEKLQRCWRSLV